jgi:hypothetical protein
MKVFVIDFVLVNWSILVSPHPRKPETKLQYCTFGGPSMTNLWAGPNQIRDSTTSVEGPTCHPNGADSSSEVRRYVEG